MLDISDTGAYEKYAAEGKNNGFDNLVKLLEENGYAEFTAIENVVVVYRRNSIST